MDFVIKLIKGIVLGLAGLTAGAGSFAIVMGIYNRGMEILAHPFRNFKENVKFLFPIVLGVCISVLFFGNWIDYLITNYNAYTKSVFLGLILGGIPVLIKMANKKGFKKSYLIPLAITFTLTLLITLVANHIGEGQDTTRNILPVEYVIYGAIYAVGAIIPGMTTLHILVALGVLGPIMNGLMEMNLHVLIPFGIGYIGIIILFAKLVTYLFEKYYGYTYYAVLGFAITSLLMILPEVTSISEGLICFVLFLVSTILMWYVTTLENKMKEKEEALLKKEKNHEIEA